MFHPLKVTFWMRTPICLTYPFIHFDAILAHLIQRKNDSNEYRSLPSKEVLKRYGELTMPLMSLGNGKEFIYNASISFFDIKDVYSATIYKRFCERYLDLRRIKKKKIDRSRGHFKDYKISLIYIPAKKVTFYAMGNPEEIDELLQGLPGLGKKISIGYGFVKSYEIEEIDHNYSIVRDNRAMRAIPISLLKSTSDVAQLAYRTPYWARESMALCAPPGAYVKLDLSAIKGGN